VEEVGNWSQKIEEIYKTHTLTSSAPPSLGGLQYRYSQRPLQQVEKHMEVISLETAMISYIRQLKQQTSNRLCLSNKYDIIIRTPEQLMIRQATSVSLTYRSFDDEDIMKRRLIRCTKSWRGRGE
jgi:hypothetical protein